jgi:hypothetical protein
LSIWIIAVLWSLPYLAPLSRLTTGALPVSRTAVVLAAVAFALYQALALVRLSRWPILLTAAVGAWSVISRHLAHFDWRHRYPMLGVFVILIPLALYFACTMPHWRKMNWALFGRPYRRPENQVEVFA